MQDHQMLDTVRSAGSTSSEAPTFSRGSMTKSLADELDGDFEDVELSPADSPERMEISNESNKEIAEETGRIDDGVLEEHQHPAATPRPSTSPTIAGSDPDSPATLVDDNTVSNAPLSQPPKESKFTEHLSPVESASQPKSEKEHMKVLASIHNRELIDRNADGFFSMEKMPTVVDVQRRVQQSQGIAALQRTLVPPLPSEIASSSTGSSRVPSSTAIDLVKCPSSLRQVTFAESKGRRSNVVQGPFPSTASRRRPASRFSLGRDMIAAGYQKRISKPTAPARFVRLPTDPVVGFRRKFGDFGLKIIIPGPEWDDDDEDDSGSIASVPDVDSAGGFTFATPVPNGVPKLEFGVPRTFMSDQCHETSCPIRFAHAKGPYHHMGFRNNKIMTGLFGHSNPPPEIWNAYRNMVHLTSDGEIVSPDGRPGSEADDDLVIAFAMFHYGGLNSMGGEEFHRRYAGKHLSSRIALRSSSTDSSKEFCGSCLGNRK